jgi:mono/diheme cytochrome c family protein
MSRECPKSAVLVAVMCLGLLLRAPLAIAATDAAQATATDESHASTRMPADVTHRVSGRLVARGRYVALAADCRSCHTAPGGEPYAGGTPLHSAFGTIYGTNITTDVQSGIGSWSRADFERALRRGVRRDGAYLYPAMPYGSYTKMTADDMDALWAYMRTLPAVRNTIPKNTLPFPLTIRSGMAVWQGLYFKAGVFVPSPEMSPQWNRGAYLVEALGHCDECHTPRNAAQGLETKHELTGAQIEGWYAPDIGNDSLSKISAWNVDEIAHFLKSGTKPGNVKTFGPMQQVVDESLRFLTDSDLNAIAVYLKDQQTSVTPQRPTPVKFERLTAGRRVYEDNCSSCHQSNGKGMAGTVPALAGNGAVTAAEPYNVIMAMLEGFAPQGTWGAMGSFASTLSDDQIADVANYVRTAWGNNGIPNATPWSVGTWREYAKAPEDESHALLCPNLAPNVIQPALGAGAAALKLASTDRGTMSTLVGNYRSAVPKASAADVIEGLSTAYCRAVAADHISEARMSAQIADFAQRVAIALGDLKPATSTPE